MQDVATLNAEAKVAADACAKKLTDKVSPRAQRQQISGGEAGQLLEAKEAEKARTQQEGQSNNPVDNDSRKQGQGRLIPPAEAEPDALATNIGHVQERPRAGSPMPWGSPESTTTATPHSQSLGSEVGPAYRQ